MEPRLADEGAGPLRQAMGLVREAPRPRVVRDHPLAPWFAVATVCFGAFMGQLDASIVTVAFPVMQRQFATGLAQAQWVSLAYLLVLIALLIPAGRWSDRIGRKLAYLLGFAVFTAASAGCGLAGSLAVLVGLRAIQAAGAAMLQANSVALVATSVPAASRRKALGIQAAAQALGLAAGPLAGGVVVTSGGWRWIFFINVPVGLVAVTAGWFLLPRTRRRARRAQADWAGMALLAGATAAGMRAVSAISGLGMPGWEMAGWLAMALLTGVGLWWRERRFRAPLIDLPALAAARIAVPLGGALCAYLVLFGPLVLVPQILAARGAGPLATGLLLTPLPAGFGFGALAGERLLPVRWANTTRCVAGGALACGSVAALAVPAPDGVSVVLLGLLGTGLGIYTTANNAEIMAAARDREAATAGGMVNMSRGIGTALGVAVVTLGLHAGTSAGHPGAGPGLAIAALAVTALAATWAGRRAGTRPGDNLPQPAGDGG